MFERQGKNDKDWEDIKKRDLKYWKRVSEGYDNAFSVYSEHHELGSVRYEKFEDHQLDEVMDGYVYSEPTVFVEIGSGTGRYLERYGCKMCRSAKHNKWTEYDPAYDRNLKLVVGIDCSFHMMEKALGRLKTKELTQELWNRILLINAFGEECCLDLNWLRPYADCQKVVCCVFNTLGNVEPSRRRSLILRNMRKLASPEGIVIISVFTAENDQEFQQESTSYYMHASVRKLIRPKTKLSFIRRTVRTDDFVSRWFERREIEALIRKAGLDITETIDPSEVWPYQAGTVRNRGIIVKAKPRK